MKKYFKLRYILVIVLVVVIFFNPSARKIYKNWIDKYKLNRDIDILKKQNLEYKKRLYYFENKPNYLERRAKLEFNKISEDEIEYRLKNRNLKTQKTKDENKI